MTAHTSSTTEVRQLYEHLLDIPELAQNPQLKEKLEKGLQDLQFRTDQLLQELFTLHENDGSFLEALLEPERYQAINHIHGMLEDVLTVELPDDMIDLGKLIARLRLDSAPVVYALSKLIKHQLHHENIGVQMVARLIYFELMCFAKRRTLIETRTDLVCHGGAYSDVERLAQRELEHIILNTSYRKSLLEQEHIPKALKSIGGLLCDVVTFGLRHHLCTLRQINPEHLGVAILVVEYCQEWNQVDRLLWLNAMAEFINERKWEHKHLKTKHILHMRELLPQSMTKRLNRLLNKLKTNQPIKKQGTNTIYHFIRQAA